MILPMLRQKSLTMAKAEFNKSTFLEQVHSGTGETKAVQKRSFSTSCGRAKQLVSVLLGEVKKVVLTTESSPQLRFLSHSDITNPKWHCLMPIQASYQSMSHTGNIPWQAAKRHCVSFGILTSPSRATGNF